MLVVTVSALCPRSLICLTYSAGMSGARCDSPLVSRAMRDASSGITFRVTLSKAGLVPWYPSKRTRRIESPRLTFSSLKGPEPFSVCEYVSLGL